MDCIVFVIKIKKIIKVNELLVLLYRVFSRAKEVHPN